MRPYTELIENLKITRTFDTNVESDELVWHQDKEDRIIKILEGINWKIQMDNELPIELKKGDEVFIPKYTYHRVFKGRTPLVIEITEYQILQN